MICNKCGEECMGFPTGDSAEDICSDCAFPELARAAEAGRKAVEEQHFKRTGEQKSCGEIFRDMLDRWAGEKQI